MIFHLYLGFSLLGCVKQSSDPLSTPILPAPEAPVYALGVQHSKDPLVHRASAGLPWQESLSGAAAAVGLMKKNERNLNNAKWAGVIAGYPYEIHELILGAYPIGQYPKELPNLIASRIQDGMHLGMSRIRTSYDDLWVVLIGEGGPTLPPFSREYDLNDEFHIEGAGMLFRLMYPNGNIVVSREMMTQGLDLEGEYWLEIIYGNNVISAVPLYVNMNTPPTNLFTIYDEPLMTPAESKNDFLHQLNIMRHIEDLPPFSIDPTLDMLSKSPVKEYLDGIWSRSSGEDFIKNTGYFVGEPRQFICDADGITACLDQLTWQMESRSTLLNPNYVLVGIDMQVSTDGIIAVLNLVEG